MGDISGRSIYAGIQAYFRFGTMRRTSISPTNRLCRAGLSLVCAVVASAIVCAVAIAFNYEEFSRLSSGWLHFVRGAVIVIGIAWILTLPLVLLIGRFDGWRLWFLAVSGTLSGPALLIALNLCIQFAEPSEKIDILEGWRVESIVTAISLTATALYLGTLRVSIRSHPL